MSPSPPLRFLILLIAGWTGLRASLLAPSWWSPQSEAGSPPPPGNGMTVRAAARRTTRTPSSAPTVRTSATARPARPDAVPARAAARIRSARPPTTGLAWTLAPAQAAERRPTPAQPMARASPAPAAARSRWSLAAWSLLRRGDGAALAAGGLLGGSQAGARLAYRLNRGRDRPLALSARLASPLRRPAGAEAALGLDWQPVRLPIHLLAERRQKLGREGRSAFALTLYGGIGDAPLAGLRIDAYAQAGLVGARARDPFGDGALRLSLPLGRRLRLGAGAWAAAQPGLSRLDLGPQASLRLPLAGRTLTVAADWRQRIAGNARPGSGPALTLATDF